MGTSDVFTHHTWLDRHSSDSWVKNKLLIFFLPTCIRIVCALATLGDMTIKTKKLFSFFFPPCKCCSHALLSWMPWRPFYTCLFYFCYCCFFFLSNRNLRLKKKWTTTTTTNTLWYNNYNKPNFIILPEKYCSLALSHSLALSLSLSLLL